ncbi:MAG: hypothetical protein AAGI92_02160 [Pseudomonadota bacterium]
MKSLLIGALLASGVSTAEAEVAGLQIAEVFMPHHDKTARVAVWYPTASSELPSLYGSNPVFEGVEAQENAPLVEGSHPIVLLSHGMGGTDRSLAWLGAAFAKRGAITIAVNHPNSTWGDFDMSEGVKHWTRALDMSASFDAVLDRAEFARSIDLDRVMAAGFSFGGWTALSLGGAKGSHSGFIEACETHTEMEACGLLMSDRVKLQSQDPTLWNASYADERVKFVVAIDPGFVWGLENENVADVVSATTLIGFGSEADRMLATNFDESGLASLREDWTIERFDPAYHFSAMPICTSKGEAILEAENDDPVCTDPVGSDRAAIHARIVDLIAEQLGI